MNYTEEQILNVLQGAVDFWKSEKEGGYDCYFAKEQYKYFRWFVESLTGKKVGGLQEWKVYLKEAEK